MNPRLICGTALLLASLEAEAQFGRWPVTEREAEGRVWQRVRLQDSQGTQFMVKVVVPDPETGEWRVYTFRSEHVWSHFQGQGCVVVVTRGAEVSLRACQAPLIGPARLRETLQ